MIKSPIHHMSKIAAVAVVTVSAAISRWRTNNYIQHNAYAGNAGPLVVDMSVSNTAFPSSASTGESVVFMYFYQNETKAPTTDITVTTTIPNGMSFSSTNNQNYIMNGNQITWTDLSDGYGLVLLELIVDNDASAMITNIVEVSSSASDNYENNNIYPATVAIQGADNNTDGGQADISITKEVDTQTASLGQNIEYVLTVSNDSNSADTAQDVVVIDTLPDGLVFVTNSDTPDIDFQSGNTLARDVGTLAPGASKEIRFSASVSTLLEAGESLLNFATVSTTSNDDNINNNLDFVVTQVADTDQADLGIISMQFSQTSALTNTTAVLNIEVENAGPDVAEDAVLEVTIPSGVVIQSVSPTPSTSTTTKLTRQLGDIGNIYLPISITFKGTTIGSKQFISTIGSDTADFHQSDNNRTAIISITDTSGGGGSNNGGGGSNNNGGSSNSSNGSSTHYAPLLTPSTNSSNDEDGLTDADEDLLALFRQTFDAIAKSFEARGCVSDGDILYNYAQEHELTSAKNTTEFRLCDPITRIELAKIITQYAINIAALEPDTTRVCKYTDMGPASTEERNFARLSCELGLMGLEYNGVPATAFDPYAYVSRAMMSTIFSRLLFGEEYNGNASCWYCDHMQALKKSGILKMIGDPMDDLLRGYAILMLMRADVNGVVQSSIELRNATP